MGRTAEAKPACPSPRSRPSLGPARHQGGGAPLSVGYAPSSSASPGKGFSMLVLRRSDPFDLEPALEEPVLNLPLALKRGHLHELTNKVASYELVHLVVLHPVATRPHDLACVRIEEGAIVWVRSRRATPDDPRRVIRMPEEKPIGVSLQPQRLHAPRTGQPPPDQSRASPRGSVGRRLGNQRS